MRVDPAKDSHKVTDETWYGAFENGIVTKNDSLVKRMSLIDLA